MKRQKSNTRDLVDAQGAPVHVESNGWYWLAGIFNMAEGCHAGTLEGAYNNEYRFPTKAEMLDRFALQCRLEVQEAALLVHKLAPYFTSSAAPLIPTPAREIWAGMVGDLRVRWKAELERNPEKFLVCNN